MGYRLFENSELNATFNQIRNELKEKEEKKNAIKNSKPNFYQIEILNEDGSVARSSKFKKIEKVMERYNNEVVNVDPKRIRIKAHYDEIGTLYFIHINNTRQNYIKNKDKENRVLFYTVSIKKDKKYLDEKLGDVVEAYNKFTSIDDGELVKLSFCLSSYGMMELISKEITK